MMRLHYFEAFRFTLLVSMVFAVSSGFQVNWLEKLRLERYPGEKLVLADFSLNGDVDYDELRAQFLSYANLDYRCNLEVMQRGEIRTRDLLTANVALFGAEQQLQNQVSHLRLMFYDNHPQTLHLYQYKVSFVPHIVSFEIRQVKNTFVVLYQSCALDALW